jgi:DNA (cytosine-5)-methyltransferase 1
MTPKIILELLILSSLPENWSIPDWASEILVRQIIGESVPPLLMSKIIEKI